jgi:hypothetical protein
MSFFRRRSEKLAAMPAPAATAFSAPALAWFCICALLMAVLALI